jgi:hypothetical protein
VAPGGDGASAPPPGHRWTRDRLLAELDIHGTAERIAKAHGLSGSTIRKAMQRQGIPRQPNGVNLHAEAPSGKAEVTRDGDDLTVSLPPGADLGDLDALLRARGLDPAEWVVERVTVNEWEALAYGGGPDGEARTVTLHQLKAHLLHRTGVVRPAMEVRERPTPSPTTLPGRASQLVVVMGDQQAPYFDPELHQAVLRFLHEVEPDRVVLTGDTMDFPTISRHQDRRNWSATAQECVDSAFRLLSDYRDAAPDAAMVKLRGNHDWRLEAELMGRAERMAYLAPALRPGEEREPHLYSVTRLLWLRELHIDLAGVEGEDWRFGEVQLLPGVTVTHEPPNEKNGLRLARTNLAGHTHHQAIRRWTSYTDTGDPVVHQVVEVGCLCRTREGLGYAPRPDWQPGLATVTIHDDGEHEVELAEWRNGRLAWRGERW